MADPKQFTKEMSKLGDYLNQLFNRSIQAGLLRGLDTAVAETKHDSSQAAAHWMLAGADGRSSRPWQRKLGKLTYLRGTAVRAPIAPVGYRGDSGSHTSETIKFVHQRELNEVIKQLVAGRRPEFRFYLYNAVGEVDAYAIRARIDAAGNSGIDAVVRYAEAQFNAMNTRKMPLS